MVNQKNQTLFKGLIMAKNEIVIGIAEDLFRNHDFNENVSLKEIDNLREDIIVLMVGFGEAMVLFDRENPGKIKIQKRGNHGRQIKN